MLSLITADIFAMSVCWFVFSSWALLLFHSATCVGKTKSPYVDISCSNCSPYLFLRVPLILLKPFGLFCSGFVLSHRHKDIFSCSWLWFCLIIVWRVMATLKSCQTSAPCKAAEVLLLQWYTGESQTGGNWTSSPRNTATGMPSYEALEFFIQCLQMISIHPYVL